MQPFDLFGSLNYLKPLISSIQFQNYIRLYIKFNEIQCYSSLLKS